jgi:penicillin-binding protein 1B
LAIKIKVVRAQFLEHPVRNTILLSIAAILLLTLVVCESIFGYYYYQYRHIVDERLQKPLFEQTAKIYAAPKEVRVGQKLTPETIAQELRDAGYSGQSDRERSRLGTYALNDASITIQPGPQSYHSDRAPRLPSTTAR